MSLSGGSRTPTVAILLAAGMGRRMGGMGSKGFLHVGGRPLLIWSLEVFARHPAVQELVVVIPPGEESRERCREEVLRPLGLEDRVRLVAGGSRRQDSSWHGLQALSPERFDQPSTLVMVHDAARPLVTGYLISRCLRAAEDDAEAAGVLPALPVRETLKRVSGSVIGGTVDRDDLWAAQTPQVFRLGPLRAAHDRVAKQGVSVTDDASLLEASGERLIVIPGDLENIKVTYPEDRIFVERLLREHSNR